MGEAATLIKLINPKNIKKQRIYAMSTNPGTVKQYNEDRVSAFFNITKSGIENCNMSFLFFAVYDGYGGNSCAEFLKENLH